MKVLFHMALVNLDFLDLDETTVGAQFEFLMRGCDKAQNWLKANKTTILSHKHELFVEVAKTSSNPVMQQFIGLRFSHEACRIINGYHCRGYMDNAPHTIATPIPTEEYAHGEMNKQAVIQFADQLHKNANKTAIQLLKETDMFGSKQADATLTTLKGATTQKVTTAIGILQNKYSEILNMAYVVSDCNSDKNIRMRCWPNKKELREIRKNPEFYAVVTIDFGENDNFKKEVRNMNDEKKGYIIVTSSDGYFYLDGAPHIECDLECDPPMFSSDEEAALAAEKDGIKLIRDMKPIEPVYLDTPENRAALEELLRELNYFPQNQHEKGSKEYTVSVEVKGRYCVSILIPEDIPVEEAVQGVIAKANDMTREADFGELENIEWETRNVKNEAGRVVYSND